MNVLIMGLPFGADSSTVRLFHSNRGHEARMLAMDGDADYFFAAHETATEVVNRIAATWSPDVLVCWCPELYPPPCEVEHCPIKTVALISDWNIYYPQLEYNLSRYDVVVCDRLGAATLKFHGTVPQYVMPLYSQRTPLHRKLDIEKDLDVVFVGNLNQNIHVERGRCLEQVALLSDRYRIAITYGPHEEKYTRLLNRARIVFNHSVRREMNLRCFEGLACGSLLFLEESNLEAKDYLRDRQEVVYYTRDNVGALVEHYLMHPAEAAQIADRGHALAETLAGQARQDALIDWIAAQPAGPRAYHRLSPRRKAFATALQYATSRVTAQAHMARELLSDYLQIFPNDPELLSAHGIALLEQTEVSPEARKALLQQSIGALKDACNVAPDAVPLWLNLAFVGRRSGARALERRCLEIALNAHSTRGGGVLVGTVNEPYYACWRRALGEGTACVEKLWAMAACRLAELAAEEGCHSAACEWCRKAIAWMPEAITPYRICGASELALGNTAEAVAVLEAGAPYTSIDYGHRMTFIQALRANGDTEKASVLADASARIFAACWGLEEHTAAFRALI